MDCLFCKIKNKEIEAKILYEDDDFLVFLDMDQSYGGHTLIIPKKHFSTYKDFSVITHWNVPLPVICSGITA